MLASLSHNNSTTTTTTTTTTATASATNKIQKKKKNYEFLLSPHVAFCSGFRLNLNLRRLFCDCQGCRCQRLVQGVVYQIRLQIALPESDQFMGQLSQVVFKIAANLC